MKIFLHIGTHRTGSTSIQRFLASARDILARNGVLYPQTGRPDTDWSNQYGHHRLAYAAKTSDSFNHGLWQSLVREIENFRGNKVIISSEEFEQCNKKECKKIAQILSGHTIRIILYLRPPLELLRSKYRNRQKMGTCTVSFHEFAQRIAPQCNYLRLLTRWQECGESVSADIRLFDKVKKSPGLEASFAETVGIDFEVVRSFVGPPANTSPPEPLVQIGYWVNVLQRVGPDLEAWRALTNRARGNILGERWPGRWIAWMLRPLMRNSLRSDQVADVLRREIGDSHCRFLRTYVPAKDREYLELV